MTPVWWSDGPRVIELPFPLNHCRHGKEMRFVTAEETESGWVLWGHYACAQCERMTLHHVPDRPDEVHVAGRRLEISHKVMRRADTA